MSRIGFVTPWGWDDATFATVRLIELAQALDYDWSVLASGLFQTPSYPLWDRYVQSPRRLDFTVWARRHTHLVWFSVQPEHLAVAQRAGCKNILVPLPHR